MPQQQPAKWAKIFDSERLGQILATKRTDEETGAPSIYLEADIAHLKPSYGIGAAELVFKYTEEDRAADGSTEESVRDKAFDGLTVEHAEQAITHAITALTEISQ